MVVEPCGEGGGVGVGADDASGEVAGIGGEGDGVFAPEEIVRGFRGHGGAEGGVVRGVRVDDEGTCEDIAGAGEGFGEGSGDEVGEAEGVDADDAGDRVVDDEGDAGVAELGGEGAEPGAAEERVARHFAEDRGDCLGGGETADFCEGGVVGGG